MIRIVSMVGFNVCSSFFIQLLPNINWFPRVSRNMSTNSWMVRSFPASDRKLATRFSATRMHLRNLNHQKFYKLHNFIYVLPLCDVYPSWMYRYNIYIDRYTVYIYMYTSWWNVLNLFMHGIGVFDFEAPQTFAVTQCRAPRLSTSWSTTPAVIPVHQTHSPTTPKRWLNYTKCNSQGF